jgi:hypothetical protein
MCYYYMPFTSDEMGRKLNFFYFHVTVLCNKFLFNNQPDAQIIQIYIVI